MVPAHSVYDGVVQFVSRSLVKSIDKEGNVTVLWPCKGHEPDVWPGTLETASSSQSKSKHTYMYHGLINSYGGQGLYPCIPSIIQTYVTACSMNIGT